MVLRERPRWLTRRVANGIGFLTCCGLIGYALYAQYVLALNPCPLCLFQRFAVMGLGAVFLLALVHNPARTGARVYAVLLTLAALAGMAISARHVWIQAQPPGSIPSCGADLNYLWQILSFVEVIKKVFTGSGECATIDWSFLGLSMPWWTGIAMFCLAVWGVVANLKFQRDFEP
jgi:protein dithiol:quinone oxidoreductase